MCHIEQNVLMALIQVSNWTSFFIIEMKLNPCISLFLLLYVIFQALVLQQKGNLMELLDTKLGSKFNKEEAMRIIRVALLCTNPSPALRPTMSTAVSMLEGHTAVHEISGEPSFHGDDMRFKSFPDYDQVVLQSSETHSIPLLDSMSMKSSSTSAYDL